MSQTRLSDFTFTFHFHALEKEMATHSSVFAWRIPGMGEPGGLPSMGSHRVRHDWGDLAAAAAAAAAVGIRFASQAKGPSLKLDGKSMHILGFPGGSGVRNLAAMQEMQEIWFWFLCWKILWSRKWQPTQIFLPGKFYGQGNLAGYSPWSHQELDVTSVQFISVAQSCPSLWPHGLKHTRHPCPSSNPRVYSNSWIESVMPSNNLGLCCPLLLPSIFPSIRVFAKESALHIRWPKYWSFSFSISPSNEYSGLTSFRIDWLDFLAVQGTLKSLLQHHSSKASVLWCSAFFMVQLSHPYMTTGKTIDLTRWTFVGNVSVF